MKITNEATAGTLESGDARVTVGPNPGGGLALELRGPSEARYGDEIRKVARLTLDILGIDEATVRIEEKGALDATIRARLAAACYRAAAGATVPWEAMV